MSIFVQVPFPRFRVLDGNGNPLSLGKVYFYVAGTTTPKDTFDYNGNTNANPVVLDSQGYADVWTTGGFYKVIITDSNNAVLYSLDDWNLNYAQFGVSGALDVPGNLTVAVGNLTLSNGNLIFGQTYNGIYFRTGSNGKAGGFVCNGVTPVTVANTSLAAGETIIIGLEIVGGTVGNLPTVKTRTNGVGFTVAGDAADTSTYSYKILSQT